jgi:hypothetical protein
MMGVVRAPMYHVTWAQVATVAAAFVMLGSMGLASASFGSPGTVHAPGGAVVHPNGAPAMRPHPASPPPWNSSITITSTYTGTQQLPLTLTYTINVTGAPLNAGNDSVWLSIWTTGPTLVANLSEPVMANTTNYSTTLGYGDLLASNYNGGNLPTAPYSFIAWLTANNTTAYNATNNAPLATTVGSNTVTATLGITDLVGSITQPAAFEPSGYSLTYTYAISGNTAIVNDSDNVTLSLAIVYQPTGAFINDTLTTPGPPGMPVPGTGQISLGPNLAPVSGEYLFTFWISAANSLTGGQVRSIGPSGHVTLALDTPSAELLAPANGSSYVAGVVNISTYYTGDYGSGATVTVFNAQRAVVDTQGVFQPGVGGHASVVEWSASIPGTYLIELNVTSSYQPEVAVFSNVTITAAPTAGTGSVSWVNTTTYNNATATSSKLFGLSPGAAVALLLVVGLIIGMIVALALGRMMWGGGTPAGAQPWKASGKNECSVCHQSFDSEAALKDHQKDAHGMS